MDKKTAALGPAINRMLVNAPPKLPSREQAVEIWVARRFAEVVRDLAYLRLPQSLQEVTKLPPDVIAALTHKLESEDILVDSVECKTSGRSWLRATAK